MKNFVYGFIAASITLFACNNNSFKVSGIAKGITDSTMVYLQKAQGFNLIKVDSALVINGTFTFTGKQDSTVHHYISCHSEGIRFRTDFFLENGNINVSMGKTEVTASGTPSNDTYQAFRNEFNSASKEIDRINTKFITDSTLTEEQKQELMVEYRNLNKKLNEIVYKHIELNSANKIGEYLFPNYNDYLSIEQQQTLIAMMPEVTLQNKQIKRIVEHINVLNKTAVGKPFIDFEMQTPDGKTMKLSDIVNKNKYTLVDFWASWCVPCRSEMPNVIEAYNEFHEKGLAIVGISVDNNENAWKNSIKEWGMPWIHLSDLKGTDNVAATLYGIRSIPSTILIAQDGTIVAKNLRAGAIKEKLLELLK